MDGQIVTFPGAEQPPIAETDIETRYAEAFRDLENRLMDCVSMSKRPDMRTQNRGSRAGFCGRPYVGIAGKAQERLLRLVCRREAWWIAHVVNLGAPIDQKAHRQRLATHARRTKR
jgi:hypothetical protein